MSPSIIQPRFNTGTDEAKFIGVESFGTGSTSFIPSLIARFKSKLEETTGVHQSPRPGAVVDEGGASA